MLGVFDSPGGHAGRREQDSSYLDSARTSSHVPPDFDRFRKVA
jgi:hypothetical protein